MTPVLVGAVILAGLYTLGTRGRPAGPVAPSVQRPSAGWAPDWLTPGAPAGPGASPNARAVATPWLWASGQPGAVQGPSGVELGLGTGAKVAGVASAGAAIASPLVASIFGLVGSVAGLALGVKQQNPLGIAQSTVNVTRQGYSFFTTPGDSDLLATSGLEFGAELPVAPAVVDVAPSTLVELAPSTISEVGPEVVGELASSTVAELGGTTIAESGAVVGAEVGADIGLGVGLGALGAVLALGTIAHTVIKLIIGPPLPYGTGYSSADNISSQKSLATGYRGKLVLGRYIQNQQGNPGALLGLALAGAKLAPHGEVIFRHDRAGFGGDWARAADPAYVNLVNHSTGSVDDLRELVSGIHIAIGETGIVKSDWWVTDWYRRTLVASLPPNVRAGLGDLDLIFEVPTPAEYLPVNLFTQFFGDDLVTGRFNLTAVGVVGGFEAQLEAALQVVPSSRFPDLGIALTSAFRDPWELDLTATDRDFLRDKYTVNTTYKLSVADAAGGMVTMTERQRVYASTLLPGVVFDPNNPYDVSLLTFAMGQGSANDGG